MEEKESRETARKALDFGIETGEAWESELERICRKEEIKIINEKQKIKK